MPLVGVARTIAASTALELKAMLQNEDEIDAAQLGTFTGHAKIADETLVSDLAQSGFRATLSGSIAGPDGTSIDVYVDPERLGSSVWASRDADGLLTLPEVLRKGSHVRLRKSLAARTERQITVDEFVAMCER